ncbi:hypothetical protein EDC96DRAFT_527656 [Choanephora cucurbitarum]|nr:hypothetical protein EDC96DRAFT_527656 [Choanephora cucurbitarum]
MLTFHLLFVSASLFLVDAIVPTARYNGGCVAIQKQMFCYGGTENRQTSTNHYNLDLSTDFTVADSIKAWNTIDPGNYQVEPNSLFSIIPLNDSYLIHGGLGYASSTKFVKNVTTLYNVTAKSWSTVQAANQSLIMPSREGTSTLDSHNQLWVWGGLSDNVTNINVTHTTYHEEFQTLDMNTLTWSLPTNITKSSSLSPRIAHTATLSKSGDVIYFIGGLQVSNGYQLSYAPMNDILQFNITNQTWSLHHSPGNTTIPSPRRLHSATAIPDTDLILIYGGSVTDGAGTVSDYMYTLNTTSYVYTPIHATNSNQAKAGPRFGHSAVLYDKRSLFIIFGADELGSLRNDFAVLDVKNWNWVETFKADGNYPTPSSQNPPSTISNKPANTATFASSGSSSSLNNSDQVFIKFNYMKTLYFIIGITLLFSFF